MGRSACFRPVTGVQGLARWAPPTLAMVERTEVVATGVAAMGDSGAPMSGGTGDAAGPWANPAFGGRLLAALPAAAFVIDGVGTILYATETAAALVDLRPHEMLGESVLRFVDAQTSWAYAASVAMATDYPTVYMGPLRVTFTSGTGERTADLWAMNRLDDPEIQGIVCLLTDETAAMGLADAIAALANHEGIEEIARRAATAMRGHPVVAAASVVIQDAEGTRVVRGTGAVNDALTDALFADAALWQGSVASGQRSLCEDLDRAPASIHEAMRSAGFEAVWVEPIPGPGDEPSRAALLTWRTRPGNPSPNQLNSIHQAAGILSIALRLDALDTPGVATPAPADDTPDSPS